MKLHSNPLSPNCRKVQALVKHLGLQIEVETVRCAAYLGRIDRHPEEQP